MEKENLMENALEVGSYTMAGLKQMKSLLGVRGRGLMIGFNLLEEHKSVRANLLSKHKIFTGEAKPSIIRLLPSLAVTKQEVDVLFAALEKELKLEVELA
jgi:acetylornithine/N-succinyldiaminopimelate aminotransferase